MYFGDILSAGNMSGNNSYCFFRWVKSCSWNESVINNIYLPQINDETNLLLCRSLLGGSLHVTCLLFVCLVPKVNLKTKQRLDLEERLPISGVTGRASWWKGHVSFAWAAHVFGVQCCASTAYAMSVHPSVCHVRTFCQYEQTYLQIFFTVW